MCNLLSYGRIMMNFFNKFEEPSATGLCDFTWNDPILKMATLYGNLVNIFSSYNFWWIFFLIQFLHVISTGYPVMDYIVSPLIHLTGKLNTSMEKSFLIWWFSGLVHLVCTCNNSWSGAGFAVYDEKASAWGTRNSGGDSLPVSIYRYIDIWKKKKKEAINLKPSDSLKPGIG